MKTLILILSFVTGLSAMAHAQAKTSFTPQQQADRMTKILEKRLKLTANQVSQVNSILLGNAISLDSLKGSIRPAGAARSDRITRRSIAMSTDEKMYAILNKRQKLAYLAFKDEQRSRRQVIKTPPLQAQN